MLSRIRKRIKIIHTPALKATDVLYTKMHTYNKEAKEILNYLITEIKNNNKNSPALKQLYLLMQKADDIVIDCAHKLAPYQTPKLESIEVKSRIEHKFVIRSPQQVKSVEEWMKVTGAELVKLDDKAEDVSIKDIIEDKYDPEQDEIDTYKGLLN